jgi:outer membrane protein OmpA-like peptidoglycan-associated protein
MPLRRPPALLANSLVLLLLGLATPALALAPLELGGFVGWDQLNGNSERANTTSPDETLTPAPLVGLRASYRVWRGLHAEAEFKYVRSTLETSEHSAVIFAPRGSLRWDFGPGGRWTPFVRATAGSEITQTYSKRTSVEIDVDPLFGAGAGLIWSPSERWGVRADVLGALATGREQTMVPEVEAMLGAFWRFGGPGRSRTEAVATPVSKPTPVVVTTDTDGDGIADRNDKCPNQPETNNGLEDTDGCPDSLPDTDMDGIPDRDDKCPDKAENRNNFEDTDGCPDSLPDTDKDGIADRDDKCPDKPETANSYQDDDGCPDAVPKALKKFSGTISGIGFEPNSAVILKSSEKLLLAAARALVDNPELKLEIHGHTDNLGDPARNQVLSQERATAVQNWLAGHGVAADRMTSRAFGASQPVADNTKPAGRAKNRRIEFKLL